MPNAWLVVSVEGAATTDEKKYFRSFRERSGEPQLYLQGRFCFIHLVLIFCLRIQFKDSTYLRSMVAN